METENEFKNHMPRTEVNFAPTNAFIGAFGEEEAKQQAKAFTSQTWAQNLDSKTVNESPESESKKAKERMVQLAAEMADRRRNATMLLGGVFGAGVVCGFLLYKHLFVE
jgi:hypothetical protein